MHIAHGREKNVRPWYGRNVGQGARNPDRSKLRDLRAGRCLHSLVW